MDYFQEEHDTVQLSEMLAAMGESLMSDAVTYQVPQKEDAAPLEYGNDKPSTEIFYRKLPLYTKKHPSNVAQRRCTCMFLCTGAVATLKCNSCAAMDVRGLGYYCQTCESAFKSIYAYCR